MSGFDRRVFEVDGTPLKHWNPDNFQPERDESCRVVYKPKDGSDFFEKNLRKEDYVVMQREAMEQPYFSKYNRFYPKKGHFCCKACGNPLYSHATKLKFEDGWPAFGACIDGAVGLISAEQRKEKEERETRAAIRLQAFVRGCLSRAQTSRQVGLLIQRVAELAKELEKQQQIGESDELEYGDLAEEPGVCVKIPKGSESLLKSLQRLSLHSLDLSLFDEDSSHDSFASFNNDDSFTEKPAISNHGSIKPNRSEVASRGSQVAASAASVAIKRTEERESKSAILAALGELYLEIHCHRCKSHLGKLFDEEHRGQDGEIYKEHHRVNGRALKYVEDDLPKRVMARTSILFANQSQMRLMGLNLVAPTPKTEPAFALARPRAPFVSPRSNRRTVGRGSYKSPTAQAKPGIGVSFQSPEKVPRKFKLSSKQKRMEDFFMSKSVH